MVKNILKKLFFLSGLAMFIIGIRHFNNVDYIILVILGIILISLGWKYPPEK